MAELKYEGKSKAMVDKLIEESPKPFRKNNEKKILTSLEQKAGESGTVTEDMVFETVKEITPKAFLSVTIKLLEKMKNE